MSTHGDEQQRWILSRDSGRGPVIYPFASEVAADEFAAEHDLIDWSAERHDDALQTEHEPMCSKCHEVWPCEHVRLDQETAQILSDAQRTCRRCGRGIGGMLVRVRGGGDLGEDVSYHGRKGACRNQARRDLERLGHTEQLTQMRRDDNERDVQAARVRAWRRADQEAREAGLNRADAHALRSQRMLEHVARHEPVSVIPGGALA